MTGTGSTLGRPLTDADVTTAPPTTVVALDTAPGEPIALAGLTMPVATPPELVAVASIVVALPDGEQARSVA